VVFFDIIKKENEYLEWKQGYNYLLKNHYKMYSYSNYFYGVSDKMPNDISTKMEECAAYGAAIMTIAPESAIRLSISWFNWVTQAASNNSIKPQLVQAWSLGLRGAITAITRANYVDYLRSKGANISNQQAIGFN